MRHLTNVHGVISYNKHAEKHPTADWIIPVSFFLAASLAIGIAAPITLGAVKPWADRVLSNAAADAARSGGNDNYLEGLAKATGNRYGPHSGFGAPCPNLSDQGDERSALGGAQLKRARPRELLRNQLGRPPQARAGTAADRPCAESRECALCRSASNYLGNVDTIGKDASQ